MSYSLLFETVMNCLCVWSVTGECEVPRRDEEGGVAHFDGVLVLHCFCF